MRTLSGGFSVGHRGRGNVVAPGAGGSGGSGGTFEVRPAATVNALLNALDGTNHGGVTTYGSAAVRGITIIELTGNIQYTSFVNNFNPSGTGKVIIRLGAGAGATTAIRVASSTLTVTNTHNIRLEVPTRFLELDNCDGWEFANSTHDRYIHFRNGSSDFVIDNCLRTGGSGNGYEFHASTTRGGSTFGGWIENGIIRNTEITALGTDGLDLRGVRNMLVEDCIIHDISSWKYEVTGGYIDRGAWSSTITYGTNDAVTRNGFGYISVSGGNLNHAPTGAATNNAFWDYHPNGRQHSDGCHMYDAQITFRRCLFADIEWQGQFCEPFGHPWLAMLDVTFEDCKWKRIGSTYTSVPSAYSAGGYGCEAITFDHFRFINCSFDPTTMQADAIGVGWMQRSSDITGLLLANSKLTVVNTLGDRLANNISGATPLTTANLKKSMNNFWTGGTSGALLWTAASDADHTQDVNGTNYSASLPFEVNDSSYPFAANDLQPTAASAAYRSGASAAEASGGSFGVTLPTTDINHEAFVNRDVGAVSTV